MRCLKASASCSVIRLKLVDDVDEAGAVGEGEDVGREGEAGEEGEEEFHGLLGGKG